MFAVAVKIVQRKTRQVEKKIIIIWQPKMSTKNFNCQTNTQPLFIDTIFHHENTVVDEFSLVAIDKFWFYVFC